jgi:hypothetical protein
VVETVKSFPQIRTSVQEEAVFRPQTVFSNQFRPTFPFQNSFLGLDIIAIGETFEFSENLSEIHNKLNSLVNEVVRSSADVERQIICS